MSDNRDISHYIEALEKMEITEDNLSDNLMTIVNLLITDFYQITMAHSYFASGRANLMATFEMTFRKCPFTGEYVVFAGLDKVVDVLKNVRFNQQQIDIIKKIFAQKNIKMKEGFDECLLNLDFSKVTVSAIKQGEIVFPNTPVITVEGPLIIGQLLETLLLVLVSFPTLVTTNAKRIMTAINAVEESAVEESAVEESAVEESAVEDSCEDSYDESIFRNTSKSVRKGVDFGLRRAQGLTAAIDSTKYSHIGGFDGTSFVDTGVKYGFDVYGSVAHSYVTGYMRLEEVYDEPVTNGDKHTDSFMNFVLDIRSELGGEYMQTNDGELAAFIQYAIHYPTQFVALLDSYDTLQSGIKNYIIVAIALDRLGYTPVGFRLDSGDLGSLSLDCRRELHKIDARLGTICLQKSYILVSNELSEEGILDLHKRGHSIDIFAVGTNLVTCKQTPSIGMIYKLVELEGEPVFKLSNELGKMTYPYKKIVWRLYDTMGMMICDLMLTSNDGNIEDHIKDGKVSCRHLINSELKEEFEVASYEKLQHVIYANGVATDIDTSVQTAKKYCEYRFKTIRPDITRFSNPTRAIVSITDGYFKKVNELVSMRRY